MPLKSYFPLLLGSGTFFLISSPLDLHETANSDGLKYKIEGIESEET